MKVMSKDTHYTKVASPIGELTLTSDNEMLTGLFVERDSIEGDLKRDDGPFRPVLEELERYWAGEPTDFDVPIDLRGTPFQVNVWNALRDIPYGETISYGELADRIGNRKACRAVGAANGRNPISIVVPCHRVIGSNGKLVGYGWGVDRKQKLLDLESSAR